MPTARVIKQGGFTTMSNYHLQRDRSLSLKAKGLLSVMLSLPDETWRFSVHGLATLCGDQVASVKSGLEELESSGYLIRERERRSNGQLGGAIYYIYEIPRGVVGESHVNKEDPDGKYVDISPFQPIVDFPTLDNPTLDNRTLGTNKETKELNNNILNNNQKEGRIARARTCEEEQEKTVLHTDSQPDELDEENTLVENSEPKEEIAVEQSCCRKDVVRQSLSGESVKLSRHEIHEAVEDLTGRPYQEPLPATPEEVMQHYIKIGKNDCSSRYFWDLACCGLEHILYASSQKGGIQVGTDWIHKERMARLLGDVWDKPQGFVQLIYLSVNRIIAAFSQGEVRSPGRYARAVIVDVLKAGEACWEAELAQVEREWLGVERSSIV